MDKIDKTLSEFIGEVKISEKLVRYNCNKCKDTGMIIDGDFAIPCDCQIVANYERRLKKSGLNHKLANQTFKNFNLDYYTRALKSDSGKTYHQIAEKTYNDAKIFVASVIEGSCENGIMLEGDCGCGKTYLASAISVELVKNKVDVMFLVVPDYLDEIRATFSFNSESSESDMMDKAKDISVLILDDLGAHNYTEWSMKTIFSIINYRVNKGLPMVITTNLNYNEQVNLLGQRTASRLVEACKKYRLMVDEDIRIKKRKEGR